MMEQYWTNTQWVGIISEGKCFFLSFLPDISSIYHAIAA
jgi:hypothetical protein